jgi:hypothetical protein
MARARTSVCPRRAIITRSALPYAGEATRAERQRQDPVGCRPRFLRSRRPASSRLPQREPRIRRLRGAPRHRARRGHVPSHERIGTLRRRLNERDPWSAFRSAFASPPAASARRRAEPLRRGVLRFGTS